MMSGIKNGMTQAENAAEKEAASSFFRYITANIRHPKTYKTTFDTEKDISFIHSPFRRVFFSKKLIPP